MNLPVLATATTIPDLVTFIVCAVLILVGAIGVVTSRNPVHAALMLVTTLLGVAVLFIEQQANFLAAVQVIVYAGAIVVLFLFVIMFLGVDRKENIEYEPLKLQRPLALLLVAIVVGGIVVLASHANWATGAHSVAGSTSAKGSDVAHLGRAVFTTYLFAFEITAALLVIAVVGAVVLARRPSKPATEDEEPEETADTSEGPEGQDPAARAVPGPSKLGAEAGGDETEPSEEVAR